MSRVPRSRERYHPVPSAEPPKAQRPKGVVARTSEVHNATRLVELHGENFRYVESWKCDATWQGARWEANGSSAMLRYAVDATKVMVEEAHRERDAAERAWAANPDDPIRIDERKRATKYVEWCVKSQNDQRIRATIHLARSFKEIAVSHEIFDADPWLFNVENGTLDLRTGVLRPHSREDMITKLARVHFDPNESCPLWEAFLHRAMGGNAETISYLQRVIGYALTGNIGEHVAVFFFGGGANGKSTFLRTIQALVGDYGTVAARGLVFKSKIPRHPTELAALHGRRFVTCSEVESNQSFDEGLVKDLTGGDLIAARRMHENFWTFLPTHKLFLAGNHKPIVRGDDEGIWRRIHLVPWSVEIPEAERDPELPSKLLAELPGILAWAVRGCLAWQNEGLGKPPVVAAATAQYRADSDTLAEFFDDRLTFGPDGRIARRMLREAYQAWCEELGHRPIGPTPLAERLRTKGVEKCQVRVDRKVCDGWKGVRLLSDDERSSRHSPVVSRDL